jgi:hypothetical protein
VDKYQCPIDPKARQDKPRCGEWHYDDEAVPADGLSWATSSRLMLRRADPRTALPRTALQSAIAFGEPIETQRVYTHKVVFRRSRTTRSQCGRVMILGNQWAQRQNNWIGSIAL